MTEPLTFMLTDATGKQTIYSFNQVEAMRNRDMQTIAASGDWDALSQAEQAMYESNTPSVIAYGRYLERFQAPKPQINIGEEQ